MSDEKRLIESLRVLATHPGARGLRDDAAVLAAPIGRDLVFTHDMLVEGIHYLPTDPAGDVAWKLLAVNLSDLAAKGARPLGVLMGYSLAGDAAWDADFVAGLARALEHFGVPLLGGDTVCLPTGTPRSLGLTAIGDVPRGQAPSRTGALAGDRLWVSGPIGDAGLGLVIARGAIEGPRRLLKAYRLPMPRLAEGQAVAPHVHAMADISDGLLIDAGRMAEASGLAIAIDLASVPLSPEARGFGEDRAARLRAVTAGDDYQLLFAAPEERTETLLTLSSTLRATFTPVGRFASGRGLSVSDEAGNVPLPERLGYEHGGHP